MHPVRASAPRNRWSVSFRRDPGAPVRLACLHHAGGAASLFKNWAQGLNGLADVSAVQLPGREERWTEALSADCTEVINAIADTLETGADGRPLVMFGHSLGAALCFGVAHEMLARRATPPTGLVLSGSAPFDHPRLDFNPDHFDDEGLLELVLSWGGISQEILSHTELVKRMLPRLRSDLRLSRALLLRRPRLEALQVPILALGGSSDPLVPVDSLQGWSRFTRSGFDIRILPGGHFFVRDEAPLFQVLSRALAKWRRPVQSSHASEFKST